MVLLVTPNPCIDKTLFVDTLPVSGIHSARSVREIAGGKGSNVARVLGALGVENRSLLVLAGTMGRRIGELMERDGLDYTGVWVPGDSRTVTTIVDDGWHQVAVKEPGPVLGPEQCRSLKEAFLRQLDGVKWLCLCGTMPCAELQDFPAWACLEAKKRGISVLLDTSGPALKEGLLAAPDTAKPNEEEWRAMFGAQSPEEALCAMLRMGVRRPILSRGGEGAVSADEDWLYTVHPAKVDTVNPVGSGDSFVAGLLYGLCRDLPYEETLAWAAAAGAANAAKWDAAMLSREEIEVQLPRVYVEKRRWERWGKTF